MFGVPLSRLLVASVIASLIGIGGVLVVPEKATETTNIKLESQANNYSVGDSFSVTVTTEASEPVNVFKGLVTYDPNVIQVSSIDYNTSVINLWAEEPWYSNGEGTIGFIGGTTIPGGFTGKDTLITVTFKAKSVGVSILTIKEIRILKHDGLGSDAEISKPIDSLFSISENNEPQQTKTNPDSVGPVLQILPYDISTDLNHDGKQSIVDVSIFMKHLATSNKLSDFNNDGKVNLKDLSILMN